MASLSSRSILLVLPECCVPLLFLRHWRVKLRAWAPLATSRASRTTAPVCIQLIWPVFACSAGVPFPSVRTTGSLLHAALRSASICSCRERVQGA